MNHSIYEAENLVSYIEQVGDFYAWIRDYWTEMARSKEGAISGMLNFGLWEENTSTMFEAQHNLRSLVVGALGPLHADTKGLEIGCGIGGAAIRTVQENPVSLACMDLVSTQLEFAKISASNAGVERRLHFQLGSAMDMPFDDKTFDFSYCIESSFHYPDKGAFLRESHRVLKPGAKAVLADITCEDNGQVTFRRGNFFLSVSEMTDLMNEAGFNVEKVIDIGDQVYKPLQAYVENFSRGQRGKLYRYWNLVLKNYLTLSEQKKMGYVVFVANKPIG